MYATIRAMSLWLLLWIPLTDAFLRTATSQTPRARLGMMVPEGISSAATANNNIELPVSSVILTNLVGGSGSRMAEKTTAWSTSSYSSSYSPLGRGIQEYASATTANTQLSHYLESPVTQQLALKERKVPTAEEIAAKKRNFNIIFWGGGIVAPFVATVFYFGFKFWEK